MNTRLVGRTLDHGRRRVPRLILDSLTVLLRFWSNPRGTHPSGSGSVDASRTSVRKPQRTVHAQFRSPVSRRNRQGIRWNFRPVARRSTPKSLLSRVKTITIRSRLARCTRAASERAVSAENRRNAGQIGLIQRSELERAASERPHELADRRRPRAQQPRGLRDDWQAGQDRCFDVPEMLDTGFVVLIGCIKDSDNRAGIDEYPRAPDPIALHPPNPSKCFGLVLRSPIPERIAPMIPLFFAFLYAGGTGSVTASRSSTASRTRSDSRAPERSAASLRRWRGSAGKETVRLAFFLDVRAMALSHSLAAGDGDGDRQCPSATTAGCALSLRSAVRARR